MRNYLTTLASGWRAGKKQARKRLTELQRDDAAKRLLREVNKWDGVIASKPGAITHAESVAELNAIRAILHPPADDKPMTATEVLELKRNYQPIDPAELPASVKAESAADLNAIRVLLHPEFTAADLQAARANWPETQPAVMPLRGPQDIAS